MVGYLSLPRQTISHPIPTLRLFSWQRDQASCDADPGAREARGERVGTREPGAASQSRTRRRSRGRRRQEARALRELREEAHRRCVVLVGGGARERSKGGNEAR